MVDIISMTSSAVISLYCTVIASLCSGTLEHMHSVCRKVIFWATSGLDKENEGRTSVRGVSQVMTPSSTSEAIMTAVMDLVVEAMPNNVRVVTGSFVSRSLTPNERS